MALKITLKPGERIIIGGAVIKNGSSSTNLLVENPVPILRQRDILTREEADTPCKRIYLVVQLMYIDGTNLAAHHKIYWSLVKDLLKAAPSTLPFIDRISDLILGAKYYQALKMARKLIEYEEEVVRHARRSAGNL
ncbi:MAG: flbT [Deltaproteobacteria bacterium]|jgi:flagellar protein FlbT|nr:flbT [Deltaproteobacteria bacterium]